MPRRLRRLLRRLRAAPPRTPPSTLPPPPPSTSPPLGADPSLAAPLPSSAAPDPRGSLKSAVDVNAATLLAGLQPRGRPILIHHWASWAEASVQDLVMLSGLHERFSDKVEFVSVGWEYFAEAPMGRNPEMLGRPAQWADGSQVHAHYQAGHLCWPTLIFTGTPQELVEALSLAEAALPQTFLYGVDCLPIAHIRGPLVGRSLEEMTRALEQQR